MLVAFPQAELTMGDQLWRLKEPDSPAYGMVKGDARSGCQMLAMFTDEWGVALLPVR